MVDLRAFKGTVDLYFIRHGESEGNRDGIIQGRTTSRLTETGREQARAAGAWFKDKGIDLVLTSPLARAAETAALWWRRRRTPRRRRSRKSSPRSARASSAA